MTLIKREKIKINFGPEWAHISILSFTYSSSSSSQFCLFLFFPLSSSSSSCSSSPRQEK